LLEPTHHFFWEPPEKCCVAAVGKKQKPLVLQGFRVQRRHKNRPKILGAFPDALPEHFSGKYAR
jgi:hypothetical protein